MSNPSQDIIHLKDVALRLPRLIKKLPHVTKGLIMANDTRVTKPMGLGWAFEKTVRQNPYGVALLYQDFEMTYAQLNEWANQIAHYFLAAGFKKGDVAAVGIENRPELLATLLGLAKIGVVSALLNTSQVGKTLTHSINLVKPKALIIGAEMYEHIAAIAADLDIPKQQRYWFADQNTLKDQGTAPAHYINLALEIRNLPQFNPPTTQTNFYNDGLFLIYTSGTTGLPKAVIFTHGRWMRAYGTFGHLLNLGPEDILYSTLPLYHATGVAVCWSCAIAGGSGFAIRRKFSVSQFWPDVIAFNATAIGYVGELCRYLLEPAPSALERQHRVTKMIGNGMRAHIWHEFKNRFGIDEVLEFYASSEGNIGFNNIFNFENTMGFTPLPYAIVQYDRENDQPILDGNGHMIKVKTGEVGLLLGKITARSPFDGYTDPEKSRAVILENVFKTGDRYFNTGDLVRDLGFRHTQFIDRLGDTFRWKGENVSTTEIENLISGYPKIAQAIVYGVEIPNTNGRAGMAALILKTGETLQAGDYSELLAYFKEQMPSYAIPVFLRLQQQAETTGTFKYIKHRLIEQRFDLTKVQGDPILVHLPGTSTYTVLTDDIYQNILKGHYRF